jgi:hypothetical protein
MTSPGLGSGSGTAAPSLQKVVEPGMFRVHFRAAHRICDYRRRIRGPMGSARCGHQPVIVVRRHQHELAPSVPRDLHWLTLCLMLELTELPLKLHRCRLRHKPPRQKAYLRIIRNIRIIHGNVKGASGRAYCAVILSTLLVAPANAALPSR